MALPTSQWGDLGNPQAATPTYCLTYTSVPGPTASVPGSSNGPVLGNYEILIDGTACQFLQAQATVAIANACKISTWQNSYNVNPTTAANQLCVAVNDRSNTSQSATYCTWYTTRGLSFPLVIASTAAGVFLASGTTAGTLKAATAGTDQQGNITNTVVVGGSNAASPCYIQ